MGAALVACELTAEELFELAVKLESLERSHIEQ